MPLLTKELSPAKLIANQALDDQKFQDELVKAGFTPKEDDKSIDTFREELLTLPLAKNPRKVIDSMEPFGYLTTLGRMSASSGFKIEQTRFWYCIARKIITSQSSSPVSTRLEQSHYNTFKGIGCQNSLNPTTMALTYLIYQQEVPATRDWLAKQLFPDAYQVDKHQAAHDVMVNISKLRWHIPEGVLLTKGLPGRSKIHSYRWINAFGFTD